MLCPGTSSRSSHPLPKPGRVSNPNVQETARHLSTSKKFWERNRAYHPGGHYWDYPGAPSLSDVTGSHLKNRQLHIDGLVQESRNSIANALELRLSCTKPSIGNPWVPGNKWVIQTWLHDTGVVAPAMTVGWYGLCIVIMLAFMILYTDIIILCAFMILNTNIT